MKTSKDNYNPTWPWQAMISCKSVTNGNCVRTLDIKSSASGCLGNEGSRTFIPASFIFLQVRSLNSRTCNHTFEVLTCCILLACSCVSCQLSCTTSHCGSLSDIKIQQTGLLGKLLALLWWGSTEHCACIFTAPNLTHSVAVCRVTTISAQRVKASLARLHAFVYAG